MDGEIENKDPEFSRQVNLHLAEYEIWCEKNPDSSFLAFAENCQMSPAVAAELAEVLQVGQFIDCLVDNEQQYFPSTPDLEPNQEADLVGQNVGDYQIVRCLGTGGMGKVWLAEQCRPVHRSVAIKFVKSNEPLPLLEKRLKDEQQALASLSHPNIAGVLDAGTYLGRPYFVMDYVPGTSLTEYCNDRRLSVQARLDLFLQLCAAIQHVHQRSLLHRDIKPSNVLVTEIDGQAYVKVIDFGLVQSLEDEFEGPSNRPSLGIGSPLWMSPEQVGGEHPSQADTRSDIFSLGAILYQLLTQSTPITKEFLQSASLVDLVTAIQEHVPDRPSVRIDQEPALQLLIKQHCSTPLPVLRRQLSDDLDYVVMQALAKDRESRYGTVMALAEDVNRFLNQEPVSARSNNLTYRLRKFATKNRTAVVVASFIGVLQLVTTVVAVGLAMWALDQQSEARQAQRVAQDGEKLAREAEAETAEFWKVLMGAISDLNLSKPGIEYANLNSVIPAKLRKEIQSQAARYRFSKERQLRCAEAWELLGESAYGSGRKEMAIADLRQAIVIYEKQLGVADRRTLKAKITLGLFLLENGDLESVQTTTAEVLESDPERTSSEYLQAQVLKKRVKIRQGKMTHVISDLKSLLEASKERFTKDPVCIETMNALAEAWFEKRCYKVSAELYEKCFRAAQETWGEDSRQAMELEVRYWAARVSDEMEFAPIGLVKQLLSRAHQKFGPDNIYTLKINAIYIRTLFYCDRKNRAVENLQSDLIENYRRLFGESSLEVAHQKLNMAKYLEWTQPKVAAEFAKQAGEMFAEIKGEKSWEYLRARCRYIRVYLANAKTFSSASRKTVLDAIHEYANLAVKELGKDSLVTTDLLEFQAMCLGEQGRFDECIDLLKENLKFSRRDGQDTLLTGETLTRLGDAYYRYSNDTSRKLDDADRGRDLLREAAEHYEKSFYVRSEWQGVLNPDVNESLRRAQRCYRELGELTTVKTFAAYIEQYKEQHSVAEFQLIVRNHGDLIPGLIFKF